MQPAIAQVAPGRGGELEVSGGRVGTGVEIAVRMRTFLSETTCPKTTLRVPVGQHLLLKTCGTGVETLRARRRRGKDASRAASRSSMTIDTRRSTKNWALVSKRFDIDVELPGHARAAKLLASF